METYGANAYTDTSEDPRWRLENLPDTFALRLDLDYPNSRKVVLIYDEFPSESEQRELMLKLQIAAGKHGFKVTRTDRGGTSVAPPIGGATHTRGRS